MKNIYKFLLALVIVSASACDNYLDVNDNPNQLVSVPSGTLLFKGTLLAQTQVQQGHLSRVAQYYSGGLIGLNLVQQTQYNYDYTPGDSDAVWGHIYNGILVQNRDIQNLSPNLDMLNGAVLINEALAIGTAASLFGDVPYATAVPSDPGLEADQPTFDSQASVYAAMQSLLDQGITLVENSETSLGDEDIFFDGDKDGWIESAYSLKARYYLQTKQYDMALAAVDKGISDPSRTMAYKPIGDVDGNSNLLFNFVNSSRAGDMTGDGAFYRDLIDPANANGRNNAKTDETARRQYSYVSGDGEQSGGIDDSTTPMKMVSYEETLLIWAECLVRSGDDDGAIAKLNELRQYLNSGTAFNIINDTDTYMYDDYVLADFQAGGMENADGIDVDRAILREIIEERYVTGFTTYMAFNDVRRLYKSDQDVIVPFPLNNNTTSINPQRLLYPQDEIDTNANAPSPIPDLFTFTPVNQ